MPLCDRGPRLVGTIGTDQERRLPAGWRWARLADVCEKPQYGFTAPAELGPVGPKLLRITDIQQGRVDWDRVPHCKCDGETIHKYSLRPGDILFARTGGTTGKSYLVTSTHGNTVFASYLIRVRPGNQVRPEYLNLFVQSGVYWRQVHAQKRGGAQPNLNASLLSAIMLPLCSLRDQEWVIRKAQDLLGDVERARTACDEQMKAALSLRSAFFREILGRRESKEWEKKCLGEVCMINPSRPRGFLRQRDAATSFVPMAAVDGASGEITQMRIVPYSKVSRGYTYFEEGDVLFAKITPCLENGKHAIARGLVDHMGFGTTEFHVLRPIEGMLPEWLHSYVRQPRFLAAAAAHFTGAVGQQRVPEAYLSETEIPVPPLQVQHQICSCLAAEMRHLRDLVGSIEGSARGIATLADAILRDAFVGRLT